MMAIKTYLFENETYRLDAALAGLLEEAGYVLESMALPAHHEDAAALFEGKPGGIVFLPAVWEDLFSVKVVDEIAWSDVPFALIIVGPAPEPSQLIVAFNEGLSSYIETPIDPERLRHIAGRAASRLERRQERQTRLRRLADNASQSATPGLTPELIARDHYLGQAFLRCIEREGRLFDNGVRALVVSSSRSQQKLMEGLLQRVGIRVEAAMSMKEALRAVESGSYAVLISDNVLPDGDACAFAAQLQKRAKGRLPRLIVWSASPDKANMLMNPNTHIDDVILKPPPNTGIESALPTIIAAVWSSLA